jgi:hypothetical protein
MADAACVGLDTEAWFPTKGQKPSPVVQRVCGKCPVAEACLDYSLNHAVLGVWGGLGESTRAELRRDRGIKAEPLVAPLQCGTTLGYARHRKKNEVACRACKDAEAARVWQRRFAVGRAS